MKTTTVVYSAILLAFTIFIASAALAECPEGKTEVTIVPGKSGRVMTICVPEAAIPHIGGKSDVVIPATCPCFTVEEVDTFVVNGMSCGYIMLGTDIYEEECGQGDIWGEEDYYCAMAEEFGCDHTTLYEWPPTPCEYVHVWKCRSGISCESIVEGHKEISYDEAMACIAILRSAAGMR